MAAEHSPSEGHLSSWLLELVSRAPLVLVVRDPVRDRWVWVSPSLARLTGVPAEDAVPREVADVVERCEAEAVARSGTAVPLSWSSPCADGRRRHFEGVSVAFPTCDGGTLVGSVAMEVTDLVVARGQAQHLLDHLPIVLSTTTPDGRLLTLDGAGVVAHREAGVPRPEHLDDLLVEGDPAHEAVWRAHHAALRGRTSVGRILWNGRWMESRYAPLTEGGEITGVVTISFDVDDQVRTEHAGRLSEARFETFMRHSPAAVVTKDAEGRYLWANQAYFDTYRVDPRGFVGRTVHDLTCAEVADYATGLDRQVLDTGRPLRDTHRFTRGDGTTGVDVGFRFPVPTADGGTELGGVFVDVTELHEARENAQQAEARYRTLFDRSPVPMLVTDRARLLLDANPAFGRLVGRRLSALRGLDAVALTDDGTRLKAAFDGAGLSGTRVVERFLTGARQTRTECDVTLIEVPGTTEQDSTFVVIVQPVAEAVTGHSEVRLTAREATVLELRAAGHPISHIASRTGLTGRGVDYHLAQLAKRFGTTTTGLVARAFHLGVLTTGSWPPRAGSAFLREEPR
ncbi:PAS domain-containing protein [Lentzea sp. NPDC058450]|uniref:PAS domain-containing protein n=1 Tax=Lentzea sp. NPDC058450 TaxID=3346505 RepID=UPI0036616BF6